MIDPTASGDYRRQFLEDIKNFTREIFNLVQWLIITVAISWAALRLKSVPLLALYYALGVLLSMYAVSLFFNFLGWIGPQYAFDAPRTGKKLAALIMTFVLACALIPAIDRITNDLRKLEDMRLPPPTTPAPAQNAPPTQPARSPPAARESSGIQARPSSDTADLKQAARHSWPAG